MKRKLLLVTCILFAAFVASAQGYTISVIPTTRTIEAYDDQSGLTPYVNESFDVDQSDGARPDVGWTFVSPSPLEGWEWMDKPNPQTAPDVVWGRAYLDGSNPVGDHFTTIRLAAWGSTNTVDVTVKLIVNPHNECTDNIDNDGDGLVDYNGILAAPSVQPDPGCTDRFDTTEGSNPPPTPQCSDNLDNDGDGFVDFDGPGTVDPGCSSLTDTTESPNPQCSDNVDNDADGKVDFDGPGTVDPGCSSLSDDSESPDPPPPPAYWAPTKANLTSWYWQLTGSYTSSAFATRANGVKVIDVDYQNMTAARITTWKGAVAGGKAICYMSAGTAENFRPDYSSFTALDTADRNAGGSGILGAVLPDWPDERWIRASKWDTTYTIGGVPTSIHTLMSARVDTCKTKGFDGMEFDNMDGYTNDPATVTAAEQLTYNQNLASLAHTKGLGVFLKNDVDQLTALQPYFDGAINEECAAFTECAGYSVFLNANKPVLQAEYKALVTAQCTDANTAGRKLAFYALALSDTTRFQKCWTGS